MPIRFSNRESRAGRARTGRARAALPPAFCTSRATSALQREYIEYMNLYNV